MTRFLRHRYWTAKDPPAPEAGSGSVGINGLRASSSTNPAGGPVSLSSLEGGGSAARHDELAALATAAERGDPVATRTLLTTIMPLLLRVVRRVLGPGHPDIEDTAFEAAHAMLEGLPRFRGEGTLRHYACRVAAFTAMNLRRREATDKRSHRRGSVDVERCAAVGPCPEAQAHTASLTPVVRELVATLPEALAEALVLHVILGYTVEEIARTCQVPAETVRSRLRLGRQALRKRVLSSPTLLEALEVEP